MGLRTLSLQEYTRTIVLFCWKTLICDECTVNEIKQTKITPSLLVYVAKSYESENCFINFLDNILMELKQLLHHLLQQNQAWDYEKLNQPQVWYF